MRTEKFSRQREIIFEELMSRVDHPSAEQIYTSLKPKYPALSLGTVYRNLSSFYDSGKVIKINCDGTDHFDGNIQTHYHFICESCKCIIDLDMPALSSLNEAASAIFGGKIYSHSLSFHGICAECKN